jgi:hypothetical protein
MLVVELDGLREFLLLHVGDVDYKHRLSNQQENDGMGESREAKNPE